MNCELNCDEIYMAELNRESSLDAMSILKIEFELNPNILSESKLSRESKKAESLHLW